VLDISRIEEGRLDLKTEIVPVASAVEEVLSLGRPLADQRGITVDASAVASSPLAVSADPRRLRQILLNIVQNAVKYNVQDGRIEVAVHRTSEGLVRIAVSDTGPGIPADALDRIFVAFERVGEEEVEGTGLGLSISLRLARAMGGRIEVDSRPGAGSTFTVALPEARPAEGEAREAGGDEAEPPRAAPAEVLYIEDNPGNVRLVERALAGREVTLRTAPTVQEGLELARGPVRPALVLLDLHLPDASGTAVLEALRRDADLRDVPIVVVSSDAMPATARRLLDAGATDFLTKPLDLRSFLATVDALLARSRA